MIDFYSGNLYFVLVLETVLFQTGHKFLQSCIALLSMQISDRPKNKCDNPSGQCFARLNLELSAEVYLEIFPSQPSNAKLTGS